MAFLLDTSVLGRLANRVDAEYPIAVNAVMELHRRGETLYLTSQNLIEFRNFATRPRSVNGLGFTVAHEEDLGRARRRRVPMLAVRVGLALGLAHGSQEYGARTMAK